MGLCNCHPAVINKVTAYLTDKQKMMLNEDIAALLNTRDIDNPEPQKNIPVPVTFSSVISSITPESMAKVVAYIHFDVLITDMRRGDREAVILWALALQAGGFISAEEETAIAAMMTSKVPDPDWLPKLSWSEINMGNLCDAHDIEQCAQYGKWIRV